MKILLIILCFAIALRQGNLRPINKEENFEISYVTPTIVPEYTLKSTTHLTSPDTLLSEIKKGETKESKTFLDWYEPILCTFAEETIKEKPIIIVYCVLVALSWLCLTVTLLCFYLRDIFATFKRIAPTTNGLGRDRENHGGESSGEKVLLRMFSSRRNTAPAEFPLLTNRE